MTDTQIVQYLANGLTVAEISKETGFNKRSIERKIEILKFRSSSENVVHLACNYLRKGLIN